MVRRRNWNIVAGAAGALVFWAALWAISPALFGVVLVGIFGAAGVVGWRWKKRQGGNKLQARRDEHAAAVSQDSDPPETADSGDLIEQMLRQGRCALLLRSQIVANLTEDQMQHALAELDTRMALVPDGEVVLKATRFDVLDQQDNAASLEKSVSIDAVFLDRYPVTNRQYKAFVDAGGYEQISLWDATVWPAILDFVDSTGHPGPRYWKDGGYPRGEADHPVVGVSWYEACAYCRWVGKRLPSDPEWVKAGAWPVQVPGGKPVQRKHPWGDTMNRTIANLWGSGPGKLTSVTEFDNGGSVGGVYQLIGNCWEWTSSNLGAWDPALRRLETPSQMKSLRGGAFDTYFDTHANNQFQSGDTPMARKHNIGFRCALGVCDLGPLDRPPTETNERTLTDEPTLAAMEAVA